MRIIAILGLAAAILFTGSAPVAAITRKSEDIVATSNRTWSGTLIDRSPQQARVTIYLQKQASRQKCRVNSILVYRGNRVYRFGPYEKWARTYNRAGTWTLRSYGQRDRTIRVVIRTNGNCLVGVGVQ